MTNYFKITKYAVCAALSIFCGCSKDSDSTSPTPESAVTVTTRNNQAPTGYPHAVDYYIPSNATSAVIFLHGGGGKKEGFAYNLGLKNDSTTSNYALSASGESWLISNKIAAIFPQGQMPSGTALSWTWNNYVMDSGEDDVAFLQALVAALRADSGLSQVTKFYLVGHSNGGMMANRMWCESPTTFDGFGAIAGPPATDLDGAGAQPCSPSIVKPYIGIIGNADSQLQTSGNMAAAFWTCSNYNASSPAWASGTVLNEKLYHSARVTKKCSGSVAAPTVSGQLATYLDCGGSIKLIIVSQTTISGQPSGGDHCLKTVNGGCTTTLAGASGLDYKTAVMDFLKGF